MLVRLLASMNDSMPLAPSNNFPNQLRRKSVFVERSIAVELDRGVEGNNCEEVAMSPMA